MNICKIFILDICFGVFRNFDNIISVNFFNWKKKERNKEFILNFEIYYIVELI